MWCRAAIDPHLLGIVLIMKYNYRLAGRGQFGHGSTVSRDEQL